MTLRIGPAGLGPTKTAIRVLEEYHKKGFRACEIAFTYSAYIKNESDARAIGEKARELDIALSIHAPYFVNLSSEKKATRDASRQRILECCRVGAWLGVKRVVFHPGYYGKDKEGSYAAVKKEIDTMMLEVSKKGWNVALAPEIMGKVNVFGSAQEISGLVKDTGSECCIDFAHLLARDKKVDYKQIEKLFPHKKWHVHFSGIIYGDKGEKSHKTTTREEWKELLENLPRDREITIVNESPTMNDDCVEGLAVAKALGWKLA